MPINLGQRIRALFTSGDELSVELVMRANGVAALAIAGLAWFQFGLTIAWLAAVVVGAFVAMTACLLFRHTVWLAAGLGGLAIAVSAALVLGALMQDLPYGRWLGGGLGILGGLAVTVSAYSRVGRIARSYE